MLPLWIAMIFLSIVTLFVATEMPKSQALVTSVTSETVSNDFLMYRDGVMRFLRANPNFANGSIPDANLTFLEGYTKRGNWRNYVGPTGMLYIYLSPPIPPNPQIPKNYLQDLYKRLDETRMLGIKDAATGNLFALREYNGTRNTGIAIPGVIPARSIVLVGR